MNETTKRSKGTPTGEVPSRAALLDFLAHTREPVGRREIVRHFRLKGQQREELIEMLKALCAEGVIVKGEYRRYRPAGALPDVGVIEVIGRDPDGEYLGRPVPWPLPGADADAAPPTVYVAPNGANIPTLQVEMRLLTTFKRLEPGVYEADPIRTLASAPPQIMGIYEHGGDNGRLTPTDKRARRDYALAPEDANGAEPGDLVLVTVKPRQSREDTDRNVRVLECLGRADSPAGVSLIAIHEHDIPVAFPTPALREAEAAGPPDPAGREDLRDLPLITIDGPDAKDFDDAVWAAPDDSPDNPGGYRLIVAIADVAHYVRPGSALDTTARERGNSVYFPDRVVPMLPEALSNGWCSLRPNEDRGCLVADMRIDRHGTLIAQRFRRALMRSRARLTYTQVQAARDGTPDAMSAPLTADVIAPLYDAFAALLRHRQARGALDIDMPEKEMKIDDQGQVAGIQTRARLDAHRLIEEFMICANVAAAWTLEQRGQPCMYRVHEAPAADRVEILRETLTSFGLNLAADQAHRAQGFNRVLQSVRERPEAPMINELILRSQRQAVYSPTNLGHFGLGLERYAHFTSPIRRYADLLVHRALISASGFGNDGLDPDSTDRFDRIAEHISTTERKAQAAEYAAIDRYTAAFLKDQVGASFDGRVTGVTRFGLFVTLADTGADGLIPIRTLPEDFYHHDSSRHYLVGERWRRVYGLGDTLRVTLAESNPTTGQISLRLEEVIEPGPAVTTYGETAKCPNRSRKKPDPKAAKAARKKAKAAKKAKKGKAAKPGKPAKGKR